MSQQNKAKIINHKLKTLKARMHEFTGLMTKLGQLQKRIETAQPEEFESIQREIDEAKREIEAFHKRVRQAGKV